MLDAPRAVRRRRRERAYEEFLRAVNGLADATAACGPLLSRSGRIMLGAALIRVAEADRALALALAGAEPRRLEVAVAELRTARTALAAAGRAAGDDAARRRSLSLVSPST